MIRAIALLLGTFRIKAIMPQYCATGRKRAPRRLGLHPVLSPTLIVLILVVFKDLIAVDSS